MKLYRDPFFKSPHAINLLPCQAISDYPSMARIWISIDKINFTEPEMFPTI